MTVRFPVGFEWGAATSSHQIEGDRAGRGDNVWDVFSRVPGAVRDGDHGDVACDHVRLMADDVAMMADLGIAAYRFSVSWPRVLPEGVGEVSQGGLDVYRRLVDLLLERDIAPVPTLFHWDLPLALEHRGGFRSRACVDWFTDYAVTMVEALGDRVSRWATFNEPWCYAYLGHASGEHAPGLRDPAAAIAVAHHEMLAHGRAVTAMRAVRDDLSLGIVINPAPVHVEAVGAADEGQAQDVQRRIDGTLNRWWFDGAVLGRYPADVLDDVGEWGDAVHPGDEDEIGPPIDWIGINYYNDHFYAAGAEAPERSAHVTAPGAAPLVPDRPVTDIGWPVTPQGFESLLVRLHDDYGDRLPPIWITENGAAYSDGPGDGGDAVHDLRRVEYYDGHVRAVAAAIDRGVDVRGYFAWSLLDNFEWAHGYAQRFGIVHVDYATQVRTVKDSGHWYAALCRSNEVPDS